MSLKEKYSTLKEEITTALEGFVSSFDEETTGTPVEGEKTYSASEVNEILKSISEDYEAKQVAETEGETGHKSFIESKLV